MEITVTEIMKGLIAKLNKASYEYYNNNNEIMSNKEYDELYDKLISLEKSSGIIYSNSPTQRVGSDVVSSLKKVKHSTKMLSLNKTKSVDELKSFLKNDDGLLSYKLDGLTCVLTYENGEIQSATTRGNGEIGEDITFNALTFVNLPKKITETGRLVLRGEAVISYEHFEEINESISDPTQHYKNPRNLCSGSVRQLNSSVCASRNVEWLGFEIVESSFEAKCKESGLFYLKQLGFETSSFCRCDKYSIAEAVQEFTNNAKDYGYPVDGLVLTFNSQDVSNSKTTTSHHPLHSIAFKWHDDSVETTLRDILVDVGKSGQISYTALFDPVEIDGTTVEKASVHNYEYIQGLELGIGDSIEIIKANQIIPQVLENNTRSGTYQKAIHCPVCNSVLQHKGVHQFCLNYKCDKQVIGRLSHWCSRDAMNIEGMSEETIKAIRMITLPNGESVLENVADIYSLPMNAETLIELDRFGKKKVDNLIEAINKSKTMPLSNVLYGLSIPQVGRTASKNVAKMCLTMDNFFPNKYSEHYFMDLLGDSVGSLFVENFLNNPDIEKVVTLLKSYGLTMSQDTETKLNKLEGMTFVITGSLNYFANRDELVAVIEKLGGKTSGSVSKNTTFLLNNDITSTSGKNKKAIDLGVTIINEEQFLALTN